MSSRPVLSAKNAFNQQDEIDIILDMPITQLRLELKTVFEGKKFTEQEFESFIDRLSQLGGLGRQLDYAKKAVVDGALDSALDIELNNENKQLLWAAVVTRMMATAKESVALSPLWKQLEGSIGVHNEGITIAHTLASSLQNDDVTFDFGHPGSWFYRDPKKNHENFDLYFMLLMGFEHTRAVELHEHGHSDLSVAYPPSMQELYKKVSAIIDPRMTSKDDDKTEGTEQKKAKKSKLTKQDQLEIGLLLQEWKMRQRSWNMMEDITVDQFAINWSDRLPQDFGYSMNHAATVLRGYGDILMEKDLEFPVHMLSDKAPEKVETALKEYQDRIAMMTQPLTDEEVKSIKSGDISVGLAQKMYTQIERATLLAGYVKNNLFHDTEQNWQRFRIFKEDISRVIDISHVSDAKGRDAFSYLFDVCAEGPDSIRLLQPKASDRLITHDPYTNLKDSYRAVVKETNAQRNQIMELIWDVYLKPFADVLLKDYEKKLEERLDQKQQQRQQQKDQSQQGQGSAGQGNPSSSQGDSDEMDIDEDIQDGLDEISETPEEGQGKNGQGQAKSDKQDGQEKDDERGGPGWDAPPEKDKPGNPKRVGDVKNQAKIDDSPMSDAQKQAQKDKAQNLEKPDAKKLNSQAGQQSGLDLSELAKGSWNDFNRRMIELAPVVNRVADAYLRIREEQKRQNLRQSKNLNFMAEDGDIMSRLDQDKVLQTKFRQATGQKITIDDFKKFYEDDVYMMHSTIEMVYMIDGSGSMPGVKLANGVTAMEAALQSAAIGYMACRKAGIDSYIVIWGDAKPKIVATPKSDLKEVGRRLEGLRNGTQSGTNLAPGIAATIESMSKHKNTNGTISGSSHILVFSDGDIFDKKECGEMLEVIAKTAKNISIDVAVLKNKSAETDMERVFQDVIARTGDKMVGIIQGHDPKEIPLEMSRLMLRRVKSFKVKSEPDSAKRQRLRQLHKKIR